jgi:hypothetical protein
MTDQASIAVDAPRALTGDEVSFFDANGWVKVDGLLNKDTTATLLARLKERMGEGAENEHNPSIAGEANFEAMFSRFDLPSDEDEAFRAISLSPEMGEIGQSLLGRPVRFWNDTAMVKRADDGAGAGQKTPWHQDYPDRPLDRSAGLNVWVALDSVPPERGAMRFLSGSHHAGVLGSTLHGGLDLVGAYPELLDKYPESPELSFEPGDATIHHALTVHAAGANKTSSPRWVYINVMIDADATYTGKKQWITDNAEGVELDKPLDTPRFPVLA